MNSQTQFEKPRGVSHVEIRSGFAQVHVSDLPTPLDEARLRVLELIAASRISIDFLKLTQSGLSFVVDAREAGAVEQALKAQNFSFTIGLDRSVMLVHCVNMRDEEGLIARIVAMALESGARVEHLSDMHDRMLIVAEDETARNLAARYESELKGVRA